MMANAEHLAKLRAGVPEWNAWRAENRAEIPDLTGADLVRADLTGANLADANLADAYLP